MRIFFSPLSAFLVSSPLNKQNYKIWGMQPKYIVSYSPPSSPFELLMDHVKCQVIDPYFSDDGTVRRDKYKKMLQYYVLRELVHYPSDFISQPFGSPSYNASPAWKYSSHDLPNGMNWNSKQILWLAWSLELAFFKLFICGCTTRQVIFEFSKTISQLSVKKNIVQIILALNSYQRYILKKYENCENKFSFSICNILASFEHSLN